MSPLEARVSLITPDDLLARVVRQAIDGRDCPTPRVASSPKALGTLPHGHPHVVMCDHRPPGLDATAALAELARVQPDVVRILLTNVFDRARLEKTIAALDLFACITEPWEHEELARVVTSAADRARELARLRDDRTGPTPRAPAREVEASRPWDPEDASLRDAVLRAFV